MPPASRSRSITVTGPMPCSRRAIAAASPDGPPPTITGPSSIAIRPTPSAARLFHDRGDLRTAENPLTAAHQGTRASPQAVDIPGRDRAGEGGVDLAAGHPLAEADDPPEVGVPPDQVLVLIGPGPELADVRHPEIGLG